MPKITKEELQNQVRRLDKDNTCLHLALHDSLRKRVTWFRKGKTKLGICREVNACGGIVIQRQDGEFIGAYYWEEWFPGIRDSMPSADNKELHDTRDAAFLVDAHVRRQQNRPAA